MKLAVALAGLGVAARALGAQTVSVSASRWLTKTPIYDFTAAIHEGALGPFRWKPMVRYTSVAGAEPAGFLGAGADLRLPLGARARPFLTGGISAGFLNLHSSLGVDPWFAWGAGIGAELVRTRGFGIQVQALYQQLSSNHSSHRLDGVAIGIRMGNPFGRSPAEAKPAAPAPSPASRPPVARPDSGRAIPLATAASPASTLRVVDAALDAMGAPYRWGGSNANGFDCSGLIVYAYRTIGLELPRHSAEQARAGVDLPREVEGLLPGDILAFSADKGGSVTHVGLYVGNGKFIHSSSGGVRVSQLSRDDREGKWWWPRWVGARRVVGGRG
ncbi:MAG: C40 family peptidase [Gemmatimonadota bacterium]